MKKITFASVICMALITTLLFTGCSPLGSKERHYKYEEGSLERHIEWLDLDPEQCSIKKISGEGESDVYEVSTDKYNLDKELTFYVFRNASSNMIGAVTWYWDDNFKDELFYAIYPQEQWPSVLQAHQEYAPDFEIGPLTFYEDMQSAMETTDKIVELYKSHGFSKDIIPWSHVQGRYTDTMRVDGVTDSQYYLEDVPKELIYQALFESEHLANINDDNVDSFNSDYYKTEMEKYYLDWAVENGLVDIYSKFSYEDRLEIHGYGWDGYYYAVVDGEATDEAEEIFTDYDGTLPYSSFYKLLKRQGIPVEGDWYHYKFTGIDGKEYEFGYDQCILEADPVSSRDASDTDFSRTFNNFYYICDGEKYIFGNLKLEDRKYNRANIHWDPFVYTGQVEKMTGLIVTSTHAENNTEVF